MPPARSLALLQLAVGGVLLRLPGPALRALGHADGLLPRVAVRTLGARHVAQGTVLLRHESRPDLLRAAAVDALHGASCLAYAAAVPTGRRAGLRAGAAAALLAGLELAAGLPPGPEAPTRHLLRAVGEEEIVELRGGSMDGASVPVPARSSSYEVVDADRGRQRYEATGEVTSHGWRVFALPHGDRQD